MPALVPPLARPEAATSETLTRLSFDDIYSGYFGFAWRCLRAFGVPAHMLDDAAQDVFVVVHRRLPTFEWRSTVRTWLYGIVRNVASNRRRSLARKGETTSLQSEPPALDPDPHETAQEREAAFFMWHFIEGLDEKKRDLFVLCLLEELSVPEAAEVLTLPLNTAYTRLRRVRAEFRRALAERQGPNDEP